MPLFVPGTTPPAVMPTPPPSAKGGPFYGTEAPIRDITASGYQTYFLPRGFIFADANNIPAKIWWNQGGHGDRANNARQAVWRDTLNRFWSHHLFGIDNGAMSGPTVVVEREDNTWVEYAAWPVPGSVPVSVHLTPATEANGIGQLSLGRSHGRIVETIVDNASIDATELVTATQSPHRLVYQSPPLTARLHVSGTGSVRIHVAIDKPAAIVSAMLVEYPAAGPPVILARGWMDPHNRESLTRPTPVQPGRAYDLTVELQPHDRIFAVGSRVGLVLLSSDRLFTLRPPAGTRLMVSAPASTLSLPVLGGEAAWRTTTATK